MHFLRVHDQSAPLLYLASDSETKAETELHGWPAMDVEWSKC